MRREAPGRAGSAWVSVAGLRGRGLPLAAPVRRAQPRPCVRSFSCTVFTFGQTGSGKTYTLTGPPPQVGSGAEPAGSALWEGLRVVGGAPGGGGVTSAAPPHWFTDLVPEEKKAGACRVWSIYVLIWATSPTGFRLVHLWGALIRC